MILDQTICIGLNHRTASVDLRERLTCALADVHRQIRPLANTSWAGCEGAVQSLVLLATCNRLELYSSIDAERQEARDLLMRLLESCHGESLQPFHRQFYSLHGLDAARHLCRVAAGLDSQVLGETQILGQVSQAFQQAVEMGTTDLILSALFQTAVRCGKRVRQQTAISNNPASISSVAIAHAERVVGDLTGQRVLVMGLGKIGQLTLKSLRARHMRHVGVVNRTWQRADDLASALDCRAWPMINLRDALAWADVVFCATSSSQPIIGPDLVGEALEARKERPLVFVDLALPRDVAPKVKHLPGVFVYDLDQLEANLDRNLSLRRQSIPQVESIVDNELAELQVQLQTMVVEPLIGDLRRQAEAIRQQELQRTRRYLQDMDPQAWAHVQHLSQALVNKLLHKPTTQLRGWARNGDLCEYDQAVRELFGLPDKGEPS